MARADDPELLAREFVQLAANVNSLGGAANLLGYRDRQRRAIPLYREFLYKHPESVYSNTVRWSLYTAYLSIESRTRALQVLDEIQDSLLQELLRVSYAQKQLGNEKGSNQVLEGILATSEDGGIRARVAQYLYMTEDTDKALEILNAVIENRDQPDEIRARALLIKADLFRFPTQDVSILRDLVKLFPKTEAGREGRRRLTAALLSEGDEAIPFTVKTVAGDTITLASLRGKAVLLYFFATWSYPSWRNISQLKKTIESLPAGSIQVIGAACDTYVDRPAEFFGDKGITWPLVAEGNKWRNTLALLYDVRSLPYYVVIDRSGTIVTRGVLELEALEKAVRRAVAE
jgi:peroxiredoxin